MNNRCLRETQEPSHDAVLPLCRMIGGCSPALLLPKTFGLRDTWHTQTAVWISMTCFRLLKHWSVNWLVRFRAVSSNSWPSPVRCRLGRAFSLLTNCRKDYSPQSYRT